MFQKLKRGLKPCDQEAMCEAMFSGGGSGGGGGELLATVTFTGLLNSSAVESIGKSTKGVADKTWSEIVTELGADPNTDETARRKMMDGIRFVCDDRITVPFQMSYINSHSIRAWFATEDGSNDFGHTLKLWSAYFYKSGSAPSVSFLGKIDLEAVSIAE